MLGPVKFCPDTSFAFYIAHYPFAASVSAAEFVTLHLMATALFLLDLLSLLVHVGGAPLDLYRTFVALAWWWTCRIYVAFYLRSYMIGMLQRWAACAAMLDLDRWCSCC